MSDRPVAPARTRRRFLAALAAGTLGGFAGCGGGDGGDAPTTEPPSTSTTATATTAAPTSTATPTATTATAPTTTATPTTTTPRTSARPTMTPRSAAPTPSPPTESAADAVVDAAGDGDYESVQAAIDDSPTDGSGYVVYIRAGTYKEQLEVGDKRSNVTLVGEDVAETVLTWDENAEDAGGTTDSASVTVLADGFRAYDLTFQNTARPIAQKVALLAEGDRHVYANCRFLSHQDTLYTRESGNRQYFRDCYVEGTTDFVFGDASAVFDRCEVFCLEGASHVTAANTLPEYDVGLVFKHCRVHGDADEGSVDLGRPWGKHARTVFVDCHLGEVIAPYGWSNWGDPSKEDTVYYAECANTGPGFTPEQRVEWAHVLAPERAGEFRDIFADWEPIEG